MDLPAFEMKMKKKVQDQVISILMFVVSSQWRSVTFGNLVTCYIAVLTTILPSQDLQHLTKSLSHHMT